MFSRHKQGERRLGVLAALILVFAVAPQVAYLGHWPIPGSGDGHSHIHSESQARAHAAHCHLDPANCSEQSSSPAQWWIGDDLQLQSENDELQPILPIADAAVPEPPTFIIKPPPRYA
jgi:hypothetical protein